MQAAIKHEFTFFAKLLLGIGIFISTACCWSYCYHSYLSHSDYRGDIFRLGLKDTLQPFYLLPETNKERNWAIYFGGAIALSLACFALIGEGRKKVTYIVLSAIYIMLALVFAWSENDARFLGISSHYQTFANDLQHYTGLSDLLKNYTSHQHLMDVHGQHYPPGNLMLLLISQKVGWLPLAKLFSVCCGLACILISMKVSGQKWLAFMLALSPGMLIFPTLDLVMVPSLIGLLAFLSFKQALKKGETKWWVVLGFLLAVFSFFSYLFAVLIVFFGLYFFINKHPFKSSVQGIGYAVLTGFGCIFLVWLFSGFNQFTCFMQSISNNMALNQTHGFDSVERYMLRSIENVMGIIYSGGLLAFVLLNRKMDTTIKALFCTVVLASFSGLFFGETERIWTFALPLACMAGNPIPLTRMGKAVLILLAVSLVVWQEVAFKHFL